MSHPSRRRSLIAAGVAVALGAASAVLFTGGDPARRSRPCGRRRWAASSTAQAGGTPIESVVDVKDARATNPGTVTDQNPLDVTVGGQGDIPLTGKLQLPGSGNAIHFGAANQVAKALSNGYSYGASGAVANSGGASVGGNNKAYPADATFDLSAASFPAPPATLPLPGAGGAAGARRRHRQGRRGVGARRHPGRRHAGQHALQHRRAEPDHRLAGARRRAPAARRRCSVPPALPIAAAGRFPDSCSFAAQALPADHDRRRRGHDRPDHAAASRSTSRPCWPRSASTSTTCRPTPTCWPECWPTWPTRPGSAKGLQNAIANTFAAQKANFVTCLTDISAAFPGPLKGAVKTLFQQLTAGQNQITKARQPGRSTSWPAPVARNPLAPLTDGLKSGLRDRRQRAAQRREGHVHQPAEGHARPGRPGRRRADRSSARSRSTCGGRQQLAAWPWPPPPPGRPRPPSRPARRRRAPRRPRRLPRRTPSSRPASRPARAPTPEPRPCRSSCSCWRCSSAARAP